MLARAYIADAIWDVGTRMLGRGITWGVDPGELAPALPFVEAHRSPAFLETLADTLPTAGTGPNHLPDDFALAADTFHRFAEDKIRPLAEHVHRTNADVPEEVIAGLAELGGFGLSVPEEFDGFATGGEADYLGMVVATEELSWGSLGIGGSLITRPEILTRALVTGGTDEQKRRWLPRIASGELIVGVMVTEPDYGSDVAGVSTTATPTEGGYVVNGVKTWATFAGRADLLMLLARTDPDRDRTHRGLSLFVVEKEPSPGHSFVARATRRREDRGPRHRHPRVPRHALVRGRRSPTGSCLPTTSSAAKAGWARASTSRWKASRTGACRPRRAPSG